MTPGLGKTETYREQLGRLARALASARSDAVEGDLAPGERLELVKSFTADNLDKRFDKLRKQVEFISPAFGDFDQILARYIRDLPLAAYDTGSSDGERFLNWHAEARRLTPEQRDYVACQRARFAVEGLARRNRLAHVRFQELWSAADALSAELGENASLTIHVNPIRVPARFETRALLDEQCELPADVLFFAAVADIRTAVLDGTGLDRFAELERIAPCTLDEWLCRRAEEWSLADERGELVGFCRSLTELGLVAFG